MLPFADPSRERRGSRFQLDRREFLKLMAAGAAACCSGSTAFAAFGDPSDESLLEDLEARCARYFWEQGDPATGIVTGSCRSDGSPQPEDFRQYGSLAVTGFGLAALGIAARRKWLPRAAARERVRSTLRFFRDHAPQNGGFFYHWMDPKDGRRTGALTASRELSEVSTIDTALFLAGALTARQAFAEDAEIFRLAGDLYERVDFRWMLDGNSLQLRHGWTPEDGFIPDLWSEYSEATLLYLLAIASPTHPIPAACWYAWRRDENRYGPYRFIGNTPLFTFQYSHAFVDYRGRREAAPDGIDWFRNSEIATRAHRQFCLDLSSRFPGYSQNIWGVTASEGRRGYMVWGGPPYNPANDGTVVPCAAAGSLMFAPDICLPALREMKRRFGRRIYGRYGFTDAFLPAGESGGGAPAAFRAEWVSPNVQGLDLGITLLSAENLRSESVWRWYMANPEASRAMDLAELAPV